jgi:hypothetical protein
MRPESVMKVLIILSFIFKSLYVPSIHMQVIFIVSVANMMFFMC